MRKIHTKIILENYELNDKQTEALETALWRYFGDIPREKIRIKKVGKIY